MIFMANTFTQLYIHLVFSPYKRENIILESFRERLEKYICGIVSNKGSKPLAIYCMSDHMHLLVGLNPSNCISDLVRDIKSNSTNFMNQEQFIPGKFSWQKGFGGFSYSRSHMDKVVKYILNQPEHHKKRTFQEEYLELLKLFEIEFNEQYLFEWVE
jgi:putative transposase